jgi:sensor histidine kinase YesM
MALQLIGMLHEKDTFPNDFVLKFFLQNKYRPLLHLIFLLSLAAILIGGYHIPENTYNSKEASRLVSIYESILYILSVILIYCNLLILVPKLLFRSKIKEYLFCVTVLIAVYSIHAWYFDRMIRAVVLLELLPSPSIGYYASMIFAPTVFIGATTGLKVFRKWITDRQHLNNLEKANLTAELNQLKSQINPHFLFNTLNNLHVLIQLDADKASRLLLGLSDLLRYQLYHSNGKFVFLKDEIEFIRNLLALEKIRKENLTYSLEVVGSERNKLIPPALFLPFVENAIKHGDTRGASYIRIIYTIQASSLIFSIENSKEPTPVKKSDEEGGGLGLKNLERRLQLLFPRKHTLLFKDEGDKFKAELSFEFQLINSSADVLMS